MQSIPHVLFYFTRHSRAVQELDTPLLRELIRRVDVVYKELPEPYLPPKFLENIPEEIIRKFREKTHSDFEAFWNTYTVSGQLSEGITKEIFPLFEGDSSTQALLFLADLMKESRKRFVFEKTTPPSFDYNEEVAAPANSFISGQYNEAFERLEAFLEKEYLYTEQREKEVAQQIFSILEPTLVTFGAGHRDIARRVNERRPVEIHYPYKDYIWSFTDQIFEHYKKYKKLDRELSLRSNMEGIVKGVIETTYGEAVISRELDLILHYYASSLTPDQIIACNDYMGSCLSRLAEISPRDIFDSWLERNNFQSLSESIAKVRSRG